MRSIGSAVARGRAQAQVWAIARYELRAGLRGRMVPAFAFLFAALTIGITLAGLGASGQLMVQEFPRTSISVLTLAVYVLPLMAMIIGASGSGADDGGGELLLAQPITRATALIGRVLGLSLCVIAVSATGFGAAGLVVLSGAGVAGLGGYVLVAGATTVLALASLSAGVLIGVLVRRRATAVGWALACWFAAAVLFDLAAIMILQTTGNGDPGASLVILLALNPIDAVRVLGTIGLGADVLLGPTGAATARMFGDGIWLLLAATLLFWLFLPLAAAARVFGKRDF